LFVRRIEIGDLSILYINKFIISNNFPFQGLPSPDRQTCSSSSPPYYSYYHAMEAPKAIKPILGE